MRRRQLLYDANEPRIARHIGHAKAGLQRQSLHGLVGTQYFGGKLAALATLGNYKSPTAKECRKA